MNDWYDTTHLTLDRATVADLVERASPGPARLANMDPDSDPGELFRANLSHGSGPVWGVMLPEHEATVDGWAERTTHGVVTCWTGNGPTSEANARLYAAAPLLGRALLNAWTETGEAREDARHLRARLAEVEAERDTLRRWQDEVVKLTAHAPGLPVSGGEFSIEDVPALLAVVLGLVDDTEDYDPAKFSDADTDTERSTP